MRVGSTVGPNSRVNACSKKVRAHQSSELAYSADIIIGRLDVNIGFIGLGSMGAPIARNIAAAGHGVHAWNRSPVEPPAGVRLVDSVEAALDADIVFTMLSDDPAIRAVILADDRLRTARPGMVHVVTATIWVDFAAELAAAHEAAGIGYVSAPVFGRPDVAAAAQLNIVAAGDPAAIALVQPIFDVIGRRTFVMGDDPKAANAAKIAGNMMIAMAIEAMAEAIALAESQGVGRGAFVDLMTQTLFGGRVYENYGAKIVAGDFDAGFRMALGLKDLRLADAVGQASGKSLPMLAAVKGRIGEAVDAGLADRDWSAVADFTLRG
jgi:3-hydroxyisobutyrate dehydrogenase-like beta-hydroxyacid dehydrogenase